MNIDEAMNVLAELRESYFAASMHQYPIGFTQEYTDKVISKRVQAIDKVLNVLRDHEKMFDEIAQLLNDVNLGMQLDMKCVTEALTYEYQYNDDKQRCASDKNRDCESCIKRHLKEKRGG
ncbi:MAG: hypothetical protein J6Y71_02240 [Ruminococcus sp.]|nr:hypothetical protein [Ruminococcus sp.]